MAGTVRAAYEVDGERENAATIRGWLVSLCDGHSTEGGLTEEHPAVRSALRRMAEIGE